MDPQPLLPLIDTGPAERADAARNRERILCAARRLFEERGASCVSMDDIARAAGVGKGTLFRRFGSRAALALTLLDEQDRALQEGFIRGEPPLGPGAPPRERLIAFGEAWLEILDVHAELLSAAESNGARFGSAPYAAHRLHVVLLLSAADPGCDAELLAEMLLSMLSADWFVYMQKVQGIPLERLKEAWAELVARLVPPGPPLPAAGSLATAAEPGAAGA
jgi:AcrR family transcriptional regulator